MHQFAEGMEISLKQATSLLSNMKRAGQITSARDSLGTSLFTLAGSSSAPRRGKFTLATRAKEPTPAASERQDPELACAIFNNGAMMLEAPNCPPLRLSPRQAGELIAYLLTLQGGLR